jgi:hypothetical protein
VRSSAAQTMIGSGVGFVVAVILAIFMGATVPTATHSSEPALTSVLADALETPTLVPVTQASGRTSSPPGGNAVTQDPSGTLRGPMPRPGSARPTPTPAATPSSPAAASPSPAATPSSSAAPTPSPAATPSSSAAPTPSPAATPSSALPTRSPSPSPDRLASPTPAPTPTPRPRRAQRPTQRLRRRKRPRSRRNLRNRRSLRSRRNLRESRLCFKPSDTSDDRSDARTQRDGRRR